MQYDATIFGGLGGGGEYVVQTGFGWSNGVIMALLDRYGGKLRFVSRVYGSHWVDMGTSRFLIIKTSVWYYYSF